MEQNKKGLIVSKLFDLETECERHKARFKCKNKVLLLEKAYGEGGRVRESGSVLFERFDSRLLPLPRQCKLKNCDIEISNGCFDYGGKRNHWYINFAHSSLFGFYGGSLLAQDEHQVLCHPVLAVLRHSLEFESIKDSAYNPNTTQDGRSTPCLLRDIPFRMDVDTFSANLYGNMFANASGEDVLKCTTFIEGNDRKNNIIGIEAPKGGKGEYTLSQINDVCGTLYASFKSVGEGATIHTGHFGCGAYGGNKELMAILQILCAKVAAVSLVYHCFGDDVPVQRGKEKLEEIVEGDSVNMGNCLHKIQKMGYIWGSSDGN